MPRMAGSAAATPLLLFLLLTPPAHAGQGTLPPSFPPSYAKVWDPLHKGPGPPANATTPKAGLANAWTCRQTPGCASHYCGLPYVLSNSQGYFRCDPTSRIGRPTSLADLRAQVLAFPRVKAVGVGHSWDGGQFCAGTGGGALGLVLTEFPEVLKMYTTKPDQYDLKGCNVATAPAFGGEKGQAPIVVDPVARTVRVHAGVGTRGLVDFLAACPSHSSHGAAPYGWALPAIPWYIDQTIGGAVATATHGSSFTYGSLSNQVVGVELMTADGDLVSLAPTDPDGGHLFRAARASVGRLGVIVSLTFTIIPQVAMERSKRRMTVQAMAAEVTAVQDAYNAAVAAQGTPAEIAAALAPLDNTQFFFFAKANEAWRLDFRTLGAGEDAKAAAAADGADEAKSAVEEQAANLVTDAGILLSRAEAKLGKTGNDSKTVDLLDALAAKLDGDARQNGTHSGGGGEKQGVMPTKPFTMVKPKLEPHFGLPAPKVAARTYGLALKLDAETKIGGSNASSSIGVYAQYPKSVALPPNGLWVTDALDTTFDAVMRGVQGPNMLPGVYGTRGAYPSQACPQSVTLADLNAYDQYEVAIPFERAGTCLTALAELLYGPTAARMGFRTSPLVRFVAEDAAYISMTQGRPTMFLNLEDHLSYNTGPGDGSPSDSAAAQNPGFWAVMEYLVHGQDCGGRLHWGKAGWPTLLPAWNPVNATTGYPDTWCDFGCAVAALDPGGKFRTSSPVWRWGMEAVVGGGAATFGDCCSASGFNTTACTCTAPPPL